MAAAAAAAVLSFQSPSHFVYYSFPFNRQVLKLRNPVLSLTEIADKFKPSVSSIESDGNTKGSRCSTYALGRMNDASEESTNGSREEIVALFRRIQSSISKAETQRASNSSNHKSTTESVMDVLHKSGKNLQDTRPKKGAKALRWRSGIPKKRQGDGKKAAAASKEFDLSRPPSNFMKRTPIPHPTTPRIKTPEGNIESMTDEGSELTIIEKLKAPAAMQDFNLSRLPSNFIKKSPILHPTAPRTKSPEGNIEAVSTSEGSASANIEKLRLPELKELAKARGIKGYSKLKKSELLQLLIP
ncbi:hypothetical protein V6N11_047809 [Hibiscus sabdariffa]|uniref:Rho termination factor-like N-terminal domain-containing protein n=1 Tax=Hibiscus sabdariffa TaxID=183260 RepID=A0ABR2P8E6_9ROSI